MINKLLTRVFGSRNERLLKQLQRIVDKINALEPELQKLSDEELKAKTPEFQQRIAGGEALDKILPEAFAVCREASRRVLGMRHYDVQLIGGMVLHLGKIAEMRTGEGKTLVGTLPVYLNALSGNGVHVITVNDYLASRDAGIMAKLYNFLGLSVGVNLSQMAHDAKKAAYGSDITYGTNNEFGFDYLRDNMVFSLGEKVQRKLNFAVVDEVDSILIDEARTPLIISGPADDNVAMYQLINQVPPRLQKQETEDGEGDYWVDEKAHSVLLSEAGHERAEQIMAEMGIRTVAEMVGRVDLLDTRRMERHWKARGIDLSRILHQVPLKAGASLRQMGVQAVILGGAGLAYLPEWLVMDDLDSGRLVRLLPDYTEELQQLHAVYASRRYLTPKVRSFIDFLLEELAEPAK